MQKYVETLHLWALAHRRHFSWGKEKTGLYWLPPPRRLNFQPHAFVRLLFQRISQKAVIRFQLHLGEGLAIGQGTSDSFFFVTIQIQMWTQHFLSFIYHWEVSHIWTIFTTTALTRKKKKLEQDILDFISYYVWRRVQSWYSWQKYSPYLNIFNSKNCEEKKPNNRRLWNLLGYNCSLCFLVFTKGLAVEHNFKTYLILYKYMLHCLIYIYIYIFIHA